MQCFKSLLNEKLPKILISGRGGGGSGTSKRYHKTMSEARLQNVTHSKVVVASGEGDFFKS